MEQPVFHRIFTMSHFKVIGCGVIGLTTAITLQRRFDSAVSIIAKELPPNTTSNIAAAVWLPFHVSPQDKAVRWGTMTRKVLESQMSDPCTGVFETELFDMSPGIEVDPYWVGAVSSFRYAAAAELPDGYTHAVVAKVPMIDTPRYMSWLVQQFLDGGGTIEQAAVERLDDVVASECVVVNCTGLGSRDLCGDEKVFPIRGQIARLQVAGYRRALTVDHGPDAIAYVLPRRNEIIVGGTAIDHDWNLDPRAETAAEILDKAARLDPSLTGVPVLEHLVGLRPGRSEVRLETECFAGNKRVVHNYGHGGAGFTLGWGCAADVVELLETGGF